MGSASVGRGYSGASLVYLVAWAPDPSQGRYCAYFSPPALRVYYAISALGNYYRPETIDEPVKLPPG